jgi:hypothetical protein
MKGSSDKVLGVAAIVGLILLARKGGSSPNPPATQYRFAVGDNIQWVGQSSAALKQTLSDDGIHPVWKVLAQGDLYTLQLMAQRGDSHAVGFTTQLTKSSIEGYYSRLNFNG